MHQYQAYLTEYDQSIFKIKVKEDGVEHVWSSLPQELLAHQSHLEWVKPLVQEHPHIIKSSTWQTLH